MDNRSYVFWDIIKDSVDYYIKKNIITEHYKTADKKGRKYYSSFDLKKISAEFIQLTDKGEKSR